MSNAIPDKKIKCPYTGFTKTCFDGVVKHQCPKWVKFSGMHPQTAEIMDTYMCADTMTPLLLLENSRQQRNTNAAIEKFRNEMVQLNHLTLLPADINKNLIVGK